MTKSKSNCSAVLSNIAYVILTMNILENKTSGCVPKNKPYPHHHPLPLEKKMFATTHPIWNSSILIICGQYELLNSV
jgi:hypothetical protein